MIQTSTPRIQDADAVVKLVGGLHWCVRSKYRADALMKMMEAPDLFLDRDAEVFKREHLCVVGGGDGFVVKRYHFQTVVDLLKDLFRPSHASRAWRKALQLEQGGLATARAIAFADQRRWGMLVRSYYVMERITGAVDLNSYRGDKAVATRKLADLLAQLHNAGFSNRDLKLENIVLDNQGRMYLIDMEGVCRSRHVSAGRASKDLARLARQAFLKNSFTRSDALRFLEKYCQQRHLTDWRWWWKTIERGMVRLN